MQSKQIKTDYTPVKIEMNPIDFVDKLDNPKKKRFAQLYNQLYGHIGNTCLGIGISRQTYYDWLEKDEAFRNCIMQAEMNLNDEVRDVLINKAASGDMTAVIFYLKKRHPDFKETPQVTILPTQLLDDAKKDMQQFITGAVINEDETLD